MTEKSWLSLPVHDDKDDDPILRTPGKNRRREKLIESMRKESRVTVELAENILDRLERVRVLMTERAFPTTDERIEIRDNLSQALSDARILVEKLGGVVP